MVAENYRAVGDIFKASGGGGGRQWLLIHILLKTVVYNLWNDHVLGWWKHKDDPNVLFVKYEDLKKVCCCEVCILVCFRLFGTNNLFALAFSRFQTFSH